MNVSFKPSFGKQSVLAGRRAFTLLEMLAAVATVASLTALLVPAVGKMRDKAAMAEDLNNLNQIGRALSAFAAENDGKIPNTKVPVPGTATAADQPTIQPIPMVATIEYKKTADEHQFTGRSMGMGTQVVIGSRSVEPRFVILLFPHRQGEEIPTTTWNDDKTRLTISWKNQTDTYAITTTPEGRRVFDRE